MTNIHPTAVIEDGAQIAASAKIGPFCYISSRAKIGENVEMIARVTVLGDTTIGNGNKIFPGAVLGGGPQDHGNEFREDAKLIIGENNVIRENATMQCGTPKEELTTRVGSNGMFMVNSHVAHDCVVGDNVIMTNNTVIGGHVRLGDGVILGGNSAVHQFVHIGRKAMIGGMSGVDRDVIPFGLVIGARGSLRSLNLVGLKRSGMDKAEVASVMSAFKFIFKGQDGNFESRLNEARTKFAGSAMVSEQIEFIDRALKGRRNVMIADVSE